MLTSSFFMQVTSHPAYSSPKNAGHETANDQQLDHPARGAKHDREDRHTNDETVPFIRDLTKPLEIHLAVGPDEDLISAPATPTQVNFHRVQVRREVQRAPGAARRIRTEGFLRKAWRR